MKFANELWVDVVGWGDLYEVSSLGQVRSKSRTITWMTNWGNAATRPAKAKLRKLTQNQDGYLRVSLCRDGKKVHRSVHSLVAEAFLDPRPEWATQVNHINGDRADNRAINLEWSYPLHNNRHAHAAYPWEGRLMCLSELSQLSGVKITTLHWRLHNGWSLERALGV